jgi:rubrerythrin
MSGYADRHGQWWGEKMKNSELVKYEGPLTGLEGQRRFVLRQMAVRRPCAVCNQPISTFEAAGIDIDGYTFGEKYDYQCPNCGEPLTDELTFAGYQFWRTKRKPEEES